MDERERRDKLERKERDRIEQEELKIKKASLERRQLVEKEK